MSSVDSPAVPKKQTPFSFGETGFSSNLNPYLIPFLAVKVADLDKMKS